MSASAGFSAAWLSELRARLPISEAVGRHVRLKRSGRGWRGLCPFHHGTSASFSVHGRGYRCFACGEHGDVISFVMRAEGLGYGAAAARLANEAGLELPGRSKTGETAADAAARLAQLDRRAAERDAAEAAAAAIERAEAIADARALWEAATPVAGTLGDGPYLTAARGLPAPPGGWPVGIRWLQREVERERDDGRKYRVTERTVIAAGTTDAGELQFVQRTFLDQHGRNARRGKPGKQRSYRLTTGPTDGAAIRLPGGRPGSPVQHAEGLETGLSAWLASGNETLIYAGALGDRARPQAARVNLILRDDDATGSAADRAFEKAAASWRADGLPIAIVTPWPTRRGDKSDLNDVAREAGLVTVAERIRTALGEPAETLPIVPAVAPLPAATMPAVYAELARDAGAFVNTLAPLPLVGRQASAPLHGKARNSRQIKAKGKRRPLVILRRDEPGSGKTSTFAMFAAETSKVRKVHRLPHVIVHIVPEHTTLPPELREQYGCRGLKVAHLRGRGDPRNRKPGRDLCGDLDAVADALAIGASPAQAACGTLAGPHCPLFGACAYQKQFAALAGADVIVVASTYMFQELPAEARRDLWIVLIEESFADAGDVHGRTTLDTFRPAALDRNPVLAGDGMPDAAATAELANLHARLVAACDAAPDGYLLGTLGITDSEAKRARHLNGRRKIEAVIVPGMAPERRKEIAEAAAINAQLSGINAVWRAVRGHDQLALPGIPGRGAGRFELETEDRRRGTVRHIRTHGQRRVGRWLQLLPVAILSGTMMLGDVRRFFPRAIEQTTPRAVAPFVETELILGAFGTRGLIASDRKRRRIRDYLTFRGQGRGHKGIVAPLATRDTFADMPDATVLWHGANAGSNAVADAGLVASIGGPFATARDIANIAAARTGEPVPHNRAIRSTAVVTMADGTGREIPVLRYEHPAAQAVHESIYNSAIDQAIGRGRPQLRTAETSLLSLIFANVAPTRPVNRIRFWRDIPHRLLHMIVRDHVTFNAARMAQLYPDEFPTYSAAEEARRSWGQDYSARLLHTLAEDPRAWHAIAFQQRGQGRKVQREYCPVEALPGALAAINELDLVAEPAVSVFKRGQPAAREDTVSSFELILNPETVSSAGLPQIRPPATTGNSAIGARPPDG